MSYQRPAAVVLAAFLSFVSCQSNNNSDPQADHSGTSGQEVATPAALAQYPEIQLPFELAKEADLAELGWEAGTVKYFKTSNQLFATLTCKSADPDLSSVEIQVYNAQGQPVGKAEEYYLTTRGASAESVMINTCSMRIADDLVTLNCSNTVQADGMEEQTTELEDKLKITDQGLQPTM